MPDHVVPWNGIASNSVAGVMRTQFLVNVHPAVSNAQLLHLELWSVAKSSASSIGLTYFATLIA